MAGEAGDVFLAVRKFGVDVLHHFDHHTRHHFFRLRIRGPVHLMTEVAATFVGQSQRWHEGPHVVHVVFRGQHFQVLRRAAFALALGRLSKNHQAAKCEGCQSREEYAHGAIILSPLRKASDFNGCSLSAWLIDQSKRRSWRRNRPTFPGDRPARKSPIPDTPGHTPRSRYTLPDRCKSTLRLQTWDRLSWDGCNPPDRRPRMPCLWCRCRVQLLRKPYWGQIKTFRRTRNYLHTTARCASAISRQGTGRFDLLSVARRDKLHRPTYHSGGDGQIRTADLSLRRRPNPLISPRTTACACARPSSGRTSILRPTILVGTGRFELPTCRLGGDRSIQLSYVPALQGAIVLIVAGDLFVLGPAFQSFCSNVVAEVHPIEVNLLDGGVGIGGCGCQIATGRCHAQHAASSGFEPVETLLRTGLKHLCSAIPDSGDQIASSDLARITGGSQHNAYRRLRLPEQRNAC